MAELLRDARTVELLRLLWDLADREAGIAIMELPSHLRDEGLFTEWLDANLIEAVRRKHCHAGGGVYRKLVLETGWDTAQFEKANRKRVWQFLQEVATENVEAEIRHRVRLGRVGDVEAARLARSPFPPLTGTTPARLKHWAEEFDRAGLFYHDVIIQPQRFPDAVQITRVLVPDPSSADGFRQSYGREEIANPPPAIFGEVSDASWARLGQLWYAAAKDIPGATIDTRLKDYGAITWLMAHWDWYTPDKTLGMEAQPPMNPFTAIATRLRLMAESDSLQHAPINETDVRRVCGAAFDCRNAARNFRRDVLRQKEDLRRGITVVGSAGDFRRAIESRIGIINDRLGRFNREDPRAIDVIERATHSAQHRFIVGDASYLTAVDAARSWCEETLRIIEACNLDCAVADRSDDAAWWEMLCERIERLDVVDLAADIRREELQTIATLAPDQPAESPFSKLAALGEVGIASPVKGSENATLRLWNVYTNGVASQRLEEAAKVLEDTSLGTDEKLTRIDKLVPFPPTASAARLGRMIGVSKTMIQKTTWWIQNRKGERDNEIGRRRSVHTTRAGKLEDDYSTDEDSDKR